jgi:hypothetical protein
VKNQKKCFKRKNQNKILKNQIKLITRDIEKEIKERPDEAYDILNNYCGYGFSKMIFELVDSLE